MGDIGDNPREHEFVPVPETEPSREQPTPAEPAEPARTPEPAHSAVPGGGYKGPEGDRE